MKTEAQAGLYRKLPSVDEVVHRRSLEALASQEGLTALTDAVRAVLASLRDEISSGRLDGKGVDLALSGLDGAVERSLQQALSYSQRPIINATGVILHTNLGRAPLATSALEHIRETAGGYSNLEFDVAAGERGKRDVHLDRLFRKLLDQGSTPSPGGTSENISPEISTIVVNNNAAAVLLALNTLGENGEVIVSRGELVEIGGSFRIPDVMAKSNAVLREVGTTNRTRLADYERAITGNTRLLLRVHRSNFEITGFTEQPRLDELVALSRKHNLPLLEDLGSGALINLHSLGVTGESSVLDSLSTGLDVVAYSGDKLLGGPQAGILSGRSDLIARMRSNSLFRALRVDKLTYAALEATLMAYVKGDHDAIPAIRMMRLTKEEIGTRVDTLAGRVRSSKLSIEVIDGESVIGGGAAPSAVLPTRLLAVSAEGLGPDELAARLRLSIPPIIARLEEGRVLLDLRTVFPGQDEALVQAFRQIPL
ncbi:MAG: L-seryl-tRNA(Sec) selenium transferase [Terriglobales bacterium]